MPAKDTVATIAAWHECKELPGPSCRWRRGKTPTGRCTCGCRSSAKCGLTRSAWINHSWHVTLYVTAHRIDDVADRQRIRGRFRSTSTSFDHRLMIQTSDGRDGGVCTRADVGRNVLRAVDEASSKNSDFVCRIHPRPNEVENPIRFDDDRRAPFLRRGVRKSILARAGAGRSRFQSVSSSLHRQVQSGAFVLGRARPGGHPVFRPARADASRRHSQLARLGDARSVFARSEQLRFLARRRRDRLSGVLFVRVSRTCRLRASPGQAGRRVLQQRTARVHPSLRRCAAVDSRRIKRCWNFCRRTYEAAADLAKWDRASLERDDTALAAQR